MWPETIATTVHDNAELSCPSLGNGDIIVLTLLNYNQILKWVKQVKCTAGSLGHSKHSPNVTIVRSLNMTPLAETQSCQLSSDQPLAFLGCRTGRDVLDGH